MSLIYPPILEENLVTLLRDSEAGEKIVKLTIPFVLNKGSMQNVKGSQIIIKTLPFDQQQIIISNSNGETSVNTVYTVDTYEIEDNIIYIELSFDDEEPLHIGEYYKIQVAFFDQADTTLLYSAPVIVKYTYKPGLIIDIDNQTAIGTFYSEDPTETLHSSQFYIYDLNNKLIENSEEIFYNNLDDLNSTIKQFYDFKTDLKPGNTYKVKWETTSNTGLKTVKEQDLIIPVPQLPNIILTPIGRIDYMRGLIDIGIDLNSDIQSDEVDYESPQIFGNFQLTRASSIDSFQTWQVIKNFQELTSEHLSSSSNFISLLQDLNVQQGETYKYGLQKIIRQTTGGETKEYKLARFETDYITMDFEHMYLCDEEKYLCIAFNPKMSTFKNTIQESKLDTIGGRYPYFFRNGQMKYKEFNISGLISYLEDYDNLFEVNKDMNISTNLTSDNIYKERKFKQAVMEWLNNGEIKLLKTATEGNYFVRLMNVSLSPNDQLGRMLHTFTASAYEVEDSLKQLTIDNYYPINKKYGIKTVANLLGNNNSTTWSYWCNAGTLGNTIIKKFKISNVNKPFTIKLVHMGGSSTNLNIGQEGYVYIAPAGALLTKLIVNSIAKDMTFKIEVEEEETLKENSQEIINNNIYNSDMGYSNNSEDFTSYYYYKDLIFNIINYPISDNGQNETIEYFDATGKLKKMVIKDQIKLRDTMLRIESMGSNIGINYNRFELNS